MLNPRRVATRKAVYCSSSNNRPTAKGISLKKGYSSGVQILSDLDPSPVIIGVNERKKWFCKDEVSNKFEKILESMSISGSETPVFSGRQLSALLANPTASNWERGTLYEYYVLHFLKRFRFDIMRTGRAGDGGIDFNGFWNLPDRRLPVLGQCKNPLTTDKKIGSKYIRDFAGAIEKYSQHTEPPVGIFVSRTLFSRPALAEANMASKAMLLLVADEEKVESIFLNSSIQRQLPKLLVARSYLPIDPDSSAAPKTEAVLAYSD